ncbi:MAG: DUF4145 domain-containing protein [Clostridiales bacterium]|nr:DUF4145 domain-containing protein [Clostridiales bacterium]
MIEIDFYRHTYTCPYCNKEQAFETGDHNEQRTGYCVHYINRDECHDNTDLAIYHLLCRNQHCQEITVVGYNYKNKKQWDIIPENVYRRYPNYIPQQIRDDYTESSLIIEKSPKAAATLLRRCLQGMIHDFWNIKEKSLNAEITALKDKVTASQWKAIDGLRSIGNIGAHMEKDVNLIIDIDVHEAQQLQKLIELLLEKWYIARHDEEVLFADIARSAEEKQDKRNGK